MKRALIPTNPVDRLHAVEASISRAEGDFGRKPGSVTLIAVSKTFPAEAIEPVLQAGHRVFGENYVQESAAKWPALREVYPNVRLHMIGPLQSNKAGGGCAPL
jgi:PLP dependent protein